MLEKDFLEKHWWWIAILFGGMLLLEWFGVQQDPKSSGNLMLFWLAVGPNLIASMITLLVGYFIFKSMRRKQYVNTMRALRRALGNMPAEVRLSGPQAQAFMLVVVPIIASLYFPDDRPDVPKKRQSENESKPQCSSCPTPHAVKRGRCEHCQDLPDSFLPEERLYLLRE